MCSLVARGVLYGRFVFWKLYALCEATDREVTEAASLCAFGMALVALLSAIYFRKLNPLCEATIWIIH